MWYLALMMRCTIYGTVFRCAFSGVIILFPLLISCWLKYFFLTTSGLVQMLNTDYVVICNYLFFIWSFSILNPILHYHLSIISCCEFSENESVSNKWQYVQILFVWPRVHHIDVIMSAMASQITSFTIIYSTDHSGTDQRKYQSSASLAFVRQIHRWPVNSPHKGPVTRKMFPFDDVIHVHVHFGCFLAPSGMFNCYYEWQRIQL